MLGAPGGFSVLHVSTHFSLRPGNALRSFLVLGDGERLTLDRIGEFDFSGLELITLSACETGLGGSVGDDGREVESLSALARPGQDTAGALDGAQRALREHRAGGTQPYRHPYYWAGFFVAGGRRGHGAGRRGP